MARYRAASPLNDPEIRRLVGGVVFAALARALGTWGPTEAESAYLRRRDALTWKQAGMAPPSVDPTNQFGRMLKGQLPTQQTMEAFETVTGLPPGTLQAWVAWPIWDLLSGRLTDLAMARALGSVKGPAREILHASAARLYSHSDSQRQPIAYDPHTWLAIRDLGDLNALVVLTMLACAVRRDLAHEPADTLGLITRALFCDAISRCPELYFRWKDLAILYEDAIWASIRMEGDTMLYSNKWGAMESDMAAAAASARQAGVPLCPERYVRTPLNWDSFVSMMKRGMTLSAGLPFR